MPRINVSVLQDPDQQLYIDKACLSNNSRAERKIQGQEWEKSVGMIEESGG